MSKWRARLIPDSSGLTQYLSHPFNLLDSPDTNFVDLILCKVPVTADALESPTSVAPVERLLTFLDQGEDLG